MDLYEYAEENDIEVYVCPLGLEGCSMEIGGKCYIGIDYYAPHEDEILAHELGHCLYGGFYNRYSPYDVKAKAERRADKWAFRKLCPLSYLRQAKGELWDIAEELNVSIGFLTEALNFYREAGVL